MSANLLRAPQPLVRDIACVDLLEPLSDVRSSAPARVLGGVGRQDVPTAPAKVLGGIARYDITEQIGEGTYGKVFRGTDRINGQRVALKRMTPHHEGEGFPRTETREIKTLKSTSHPSMVKLIEVVTSLGSAPEGLQLAGPAAAAGGSGTSHSGSERATGTGNASGGNAGTGSEAGSQHALAAGAMGQTERSGDIYMVFEYVDYDLAGEREWTDLTDLTGGGARVSANTPRTAGSHLHRLTGRRGLAILGQLHSSFEPMPLKLTPLPCL